MTGALAAGAIVIAGWVGLTVAAGWWLARSEDRHAPRVRP